MKEGMEKVNRRRTWIGIIIMIGWMMVFSGIWMIGGLAEAFIFCGFMLFCCSLFFGVVLND